MTSARAGRLRNGLLTLIVFCAYALSACAASPSTPISPAAGPTPTVTAPVDVPVVITLAGQFRGDELALLDEQVAQFEAANPDVMVDTVEVRGNTDRRRENISEQLATGDAGLDVLLLDDVWLAEFATRGWLLPLDEYARSQGLKIGGFLPGAVAGTTFDGQLVALPWIVDAGLLYYRQDLLSQLSDTPPATWDDLQRLALDLRLQGGLPYGYVWQGAAYESLTCNTLEFMWAYGGEVFDETGRSSFDSPATRAALLQMSELVATGASPGDLATYEEGKTLLTFRNGEAALMRNWPYAWDRLEQSESLVSGQVGAAPLPASCLMGQTLALSSQSMYPQQAFRLMQFLVGYDQQLQVASRLRRPPALEAVYDDANLLVQQPFFETLHTALATARPRPGTPLYPQVSEAIYTEVNRLLAGEQTADETAASVQRRIEAILRH
jgi:multiple sugar transport system substrate-binding protein